MQLSEIIIQKTDPVLVRWKKIFSRITWKERGNINQYILDILYNKRALENEEPVQQFLVEAFDISCSTGYIQRDELLGDLWLSISLNFLKSLKWGLILFCNNANEGKVAYIYLGWTIGFIRYNSQNSVWNYVARDVQWVILSEQVLGRLEFEFYVLNSLHTNLSATIIIKPQPRNL